MKNEESFFIIGGDFFIVDVFSFVGAENLLS